MPQEVTLRCGSFQKRLTLTENQERILNDLSPRVRISGPPGTGKTLVLMRKGLKWLQAGNDVIVFGLHQTSMPSSRLVYLQLSEAYQQSQDPLAPENPTWGKVKYEHVILRDAGTLGSSLNALFRHGEDLHVLIDDLCPEDGFSQEMTLVFMRELRKRDPGVHVWMSDWFTANPPEGFSTHILTEAVRYPLPVFLEIRLAAEVLVQTGLVPDSHHYSSQDSGAYPYGPEVIHTTHSGGRGAEVWPINSLKCGKKVAQILRDIGVGPSQGGKYQYQDVLIITRNIVDPTQPPAAFLRGLEASGYPTQVFTKSPDGRLLPAEEALDHVILGKENRVTLMNYTAARGLDRPVVVCLTGAGPDEQYELSAQDKRHLEQNLQQALTITETSGNFTQTVTLRKNVTKAEWREEKKALEHRLKSKMILSHRLNIWSRASEQLVVVHLPQSLEGGPQSGKSSCTIL
ncbi:hypothetical protein ACOMHN_059928 [Nucella lapillus]